VFELLFTNFHFELNVTEKHILPQIGLFIFQFIKLARWHLDQGFSGLAWDTDLYACLGAILKLCSEKVQGLWLHLLFTLIAFEWSIFLHNFRVALTTAEISHFVLCRADRCQWTAHRLQHFISLAVRRQTFHKFNGLLALRGWLRVRSFKLFL